MYASAPGPPSDAAVAFVLDGHTLAASHRASFWVSNRADDAPGFCLDHVSPGVHRLLAVATLPNGDRPTSDTVELYVLPSVNARFSFSLAPFGHQPEVQRNSLATSTRKTSTFGVELSTA